MLTKMFCLIDDFCKSLQSSVEGKKLLGTSGSSHRHESLSLSERMTITVLFHRMGWRNFKNFYNHYVCHYLKKEFPSLTSYERFTALMPRTLLPLIAFMNKLRGKSRGIAFADSTTIKVPYQA